LLDMTNRIGEKKSNPIGSRFARMQRDRSRRIPLLHALPFVLCISPAVDHPFVEAFEGNSARCWVGEDRLCTPMSGMIKNWVVGFKWSFAIGNNQQCWRLSAQSRYLQISGIFPDIWIVKRALRMSFFERALVQHVVEDHRNAERADLDGLIARIF